jgi:hypothetical protein
MPEKRANFFFRKWKKGSGEYMRERERESRNRAKCGGFPHNPLLFTHDGF